MSETNRILTVTFKATQDAEDLFYCKETKKVYARQPTNVDDIVFWYTTCKWTGGYEADCHIREGITMRVVDKFGEVLFEETLEKDTWNGGTSAKKVGEFRRESFNRICSTYAAEHGLTSYEEWKKWLTEDIEKHQYKDYVDNWLYWERFELGRVVVADACILGETYKVVRFKCRHRISGKTWEETELYDAKQEICEGICGYKLL